MSKKSNKIFYCTIVCLSMLVIFYQCNKNDNPSAPPAETKSVWPGDTIAYNVTYQPSAKIVQRSDVAGCIDTANCNPSSGTYRFVNAPNSILSLLSGQTVLFEGLDLVKISSVSISGTSITLQCKPDSLTNLIKDGSIIYRGTVSMDTTNKLSKIAAGATPTSKPIYPTQNTIKFIGIFPGNVDVQYTLTKGAGTTTVDGTAKITANPGVKVTIGVKGSVNEFQCQYENVFKDGKLVYRKFVMRDVDALLNVSFGGIQAGDDDKMIKLPMMLKIPIPLGVLPIPLWVGVGWGIEFTSTLADTSTARGIASFTLKGSMGFEETPGNLNLLGEGFSVESDFSQNEMVSVIKAGMGVIIEFPKVAIGIGESVLQGDVYATMKNEMVLNFVPHYESAGGFPVITGNCYTGNINTGIYVGAETKLLGCLELKTEKQVYAKVREKFKTGKNCQ